MNGIRHKGIALVLATFSGILIFAGVALLLLDYLELSATSPRDKAQVKALEEQVRQDAEIAPVLTAEREKQTQKSLQRDLVTSWTRIFLIISSSIFLISVSQVDSKWQRKILPVSKLEHLRSIPSSSPDGKLVALELESKQIELNLEPVYAFVSQHGKDPEAAIPILQSIQTHYGYLPDDALKLVCELTEITPAQITGTSTFYSQFRKSPLGDHIVKVCHGTACHVSGIVQITEEIHRHLKIPAGEDTDPTGTFTVEKVACLGCCSLAPVMMIDDRTVGRLTPASACHSLHDQPEVAS